MQILAITIITLSFITICSALYNKDITLAIWAFNTMSWAGLYLAK